MSYVPGPWKLIVDFPYHVIYPQEGPAFAQVFSHDLEAQEDTAHLIAAAPELLEAAKDVICLSFGEEDYDDQDLERVMHALGKAIEKAEGKEERS